MFTVKSFDGLKGALALSCVCLLFVCGVCGYREKRVVINVLNILNLNVLILVVKYRIINRHRLEFPCVCFE